MNNNPQNEARRRRAERYTSLFRKRPLNDASLEEVGQVAIDYTRANYSVTGIPKVVTVRSVNINELPSLGFGEIGYSPEQESRPLMLVVIKGNFDLSDGILAGETNPNARPQVKYIAYVFDLREGIPMITSTGLRGNYFRNLLDDPSLPDLQLGDPDVTEGRRPEAVPRGTASLSTEEAMPPRPRLNEGEGLR